MKKIIEQLKRANKTISTMESCTGGFIANNITNYDGSSSVFKFSAITYSNDFKIKLGVSRKLIDKYSVYSAQVAQDMSEKICLFSGSNYGVGITGKLNRVDENNLYGNDNEVFICVCDKDNNKFYESNIIVYKKTREENKQLVLDEVLKILHKVIK